MRLDARTSVIRVCDVVTLSHVHASTMSVHTGDIVLASQRIQKLKWVCYSQLGTNILVVYILDECTFTVSCVGENPCIHIMYIRLCSLFAQLFTHTGGGGLLLCA